MSISPLDFTKSTTIFALDVAGDACNTFHTHIAKSGNISLEIGFQEPLKESVQLLVYAVYPNVLVISKDRSTRLEHII